MQICSLAIPDLKLLMELVSQLGYPEKLEDLQKRFEKMAGDPFNAWFVAKDQQKLLGWIQVNKESATLLAEDRAEVSALIVDESSRSQGVGTALLRAAEEWAKSKNLLIVRVRTNVKREGAHRFYAREGYTLKKSWHLYVKNLS